MAPALSSEVFILMELHGTLPVGAVDKGVTLGEIAKLKYLRRGSVDSVEVKNGDVVKLGSAHSKGVTYNSTISE